MNAEQEQMFQLQNTPGPTVNIPGQVVQAGDPMVESTEVEVVSEGLAQSMQWMASNGPTRPIHRGRARMMTKTQLEEQKMNEATGLPSNLDEASRVQALETMVSNLNDNMGKMATILTKMAEGQPPKVEYVDPPNYPSPEQGPPPTPLENPVAKPLDSSAPNGTLAAVLNPPTYQPPVPPMVTETPVPQPPVSPPATSLPVSPQPVSPETVPPIESPIPASLGPVGSRGTDEQQVDFDHFQLVEENPVVSPDEEDKLIAGEQTFQVDSVEQKRLGRQQILTDQVTTWLNSKDPHKFWRQFVAGACNKNLSYNTWPKEYQAAFDLRFNAMVRDPVFIANLCGRVLKFQNGHLVACHVMGAFVVATAGFLSFALIEE